MRIECPTREELGRVLREAGDGSLDFVVLVSAVLSADELRATLDECVRALKAGGLLFVQGRPEYLPEWGVYLDRRLHFKYWIAIQSALQKRGSGLPSVHAAVLMFVKGDRFNIQQVRFPHRRCAFCGRTLKDWGGKTHLMHPDGYLISDVWTDLPPDDNYTRLLTPALDTILRMLDPGTTADGAHYQLGETDLFQRAGVHVPTGEGRGVIGPREGLAGSCVEESPLQYHLPGFIEPKVRPRRPAGPVQIGDELFNVVHHGDALEILKQYPDHSIDLAFADPPYNLNKSYGVYDDEHEEEQYIRWCNAWLEEYVRLLKPTGSLYVLNLPRWTMYHAAFLNQRLYFQNWIVWDALSEPRGKLMPAHYGLLFYTAHPTDFTFNYDAIAELDAPYYCLRPSCIRQRKARGADDKVPLTDLWWDVHRIKHRRDRDYHPCQLPDALMERIIRLSTNPGDVVLDALCGTGTTAVTALRLGRRYVAIDIDEEYVRITREKLAEVQRNGYVARESIRKPRRPYTKKELQLELRNLAARLGRLPTPEDVQQMSQYDVNAFFEMFPTWGKALKAARLEVQP